MKKTTIILLIIALLFTYTVPNYTYAAANKLEINDRAQLSINQLKILTLKYINIINNALNKEDVPTKKTIKILSIGNSFSQDSAYYLYDIAKSAGINVVVGNLYNSGCSLERHQQYANTNKKAYTYYKWTSTGLKTYDNKTMKDVILDEKWDYITLQQSSGESGIYKTFQPFLNELITYIKEISDNPSVKFALNMTWAYSSKSTNNNFDYYMSNQLFMYDLITKAYEKAFNETEIDIIIPSGTAIQNARKNKYLKAVGNELTSDGYHLSGMGRYIAGLTLFQTIVAKVENENADLLNDVTFIPNTKDSTEDLADLAKKAVINSLESSFKITE